MSSIRNAVQRRNHKERAQPLERSKLGLLEKHKDYALRAKDYKKKQSTLKSLRQKAAERNEDEFYFSMVSRKGPGSALTGGKRWDGTVRGDRGNTALSVETVRLLKTQDMGYLRTMRNIALKEVTDLEQRAILAGAMTGEAEVDYDEDDEDMDITPSSRPQAPKKIVFLDDDQEAETVLPSRKDDQELDDDDDEDEEMEDGHGDAEEREARRKASNAARLRRKLQIAKKKLKALTDAEYELELQRARMAKTATSSGIGKNGKKMKVRERKR
ncbi:U3 small nucleolar RNA-associated protein 11 [Pleurostoma richardsiae]|uniref:U3 small nucleolar RNA-associated protein 11 n=1 Tax=Pleurostoma richardsiae TaxID=41990 RepID=A0AA38S7I3_9PEZI|nr:U3 small nucleolar RNA-associated protein 11 [Pleurostoma richardsiae]